MTTSRTVSLVQFPHPGREWGPNRAKECRQWTPGKGGHGRKFLSCRGERIDNDDRRVREDELRFWGEWEPPSRVTQYDRPAPGEPNWLHRPYLPTGPPPGRLNTDPFVFGDRGFLYTVCRQWYRGGPSWLQDLGRGSVILFGSAKDVLTRNPRFVLDTVFVVSGIQEDKASSRESLGPLVPDEYWDITLDPIYGGPGTRCVPLGEGPYTLYWGATFDHPVDDMYSFFPCRPASHSRPCFPRPTISINSIGGLLPKSQVARRVSIVHGQDVRAVWDQVVSAVRNQGCDLGIAATMPTVDSTPCDTA